MPPLTILDKIKNLQLQSGGFPSHHGELERPDATAWALIVLASSQADSTAYDKGSAYLASLQGSDGRICIDRNSSTASWPTALAIMAWNHSLKFQQNRESSVQFLLEFSGQHFPKPENSIIGHDPSILGWPWIADTHSWVIPTGMAMIALQIAGVGQHTRVDQGADMLIDRQLPHGGWNYGNTLAFGKTLHPLPECTGVALQALSTKIPRSRIDRSLDYLLQQPPLLRTPISLAWTILGLSAWGLKPDDTNTLISDSLNLQKRYGTYSLPSLALLYCASHAPQGLHSLFHTSHSQQSMVGSLAAPRS